MAAAARRVLLLLAAACLLAAASARPCGHAQTLLISFSSFSRPNPDPANPAPLTTTVVTVLRVRRLGPHLQIRRPAEPLPSAAVTSPADTSASSFQERAKDILVVVSGLLFGFGCGALTAASMYLVWSLLASTAACPYDEVYSDDEDEEMVDAESPKKAGYVIIHDAEDFVAAGAMWWMIGFGIFLASTAACPYDEVYSDDEDEEMVDAESPKKAGYVIIHDAEDFVAAGGKN